MSSKIYLRSSISIYGGECLREAQIYFLYYYYYYYYRIFRPTSITRALSIQKESEIVKNKHARYMLERFPTDNARVICTKKVSENTVLCIKHNFQLKLVCFIHSVALLSQGTVLQLTTDH